MGKLSSHVTGDFACVAFKRKDKRTLARYLGRISDKEIVEKSNFCQLIETGDQYLADKGFEIYRRESVHSSQEIFCH